MKQMGKAFKRAIMTTDAHRINNNIPLIQDTTELITPELADKFLKDNKGNRPVNWNKVEQFKVQMLAGKWKFHAQGIIFDYSGNLLTGQKRLWAIILSGTSQYMRISRGSPPDTADLIDRGVAQTTRDLASRNTGRKHSPIEVRIVRGVLALKGNIKPSTEDIAGCIEHYDGILKVIMKQMRGVKKSF